jgi:hypothetical protein
MTIDALPDEALLEVFSFYLVEESEDEDMELWHPLVHVCRRWRNIVFASPRRLNVRVFYTPTRQVNVMLDTWPDLPIQISAQGYKSLRWHGDNNLVAALGHTDRICRIHFNKISCSAVEGFLPAMQKPFPALTSLAIDCSDYVDMEPMAVLPEAFLGGFAQHLRSCDLWAVEFPGIWKLLSSANNLVTLSLWDIPDSMYASPEEMATYLSTTPNLESLSIGFDYPQSLDNEPSRLLSPTRVVLPSLTKLEFQVMNEYVEDFVSRIDAPLLDKVDITFFDQPDFSTSRLRDFLAPNKNFKADGEGRVIFWDYTIEMGLGSLFLGISCHSLGRQVSSMVRLCGSYLDHTSTLERLDIYIDPMLFLDEDEIENIQWLDLFHPFTGLKDLRLDKRLVPQYALALRELAGERVAEVLPALQNLFIEELEPSGTIREALDQFVAARQLSGLPVLVHSWDALVDYRKGVQGLNQI